MPAALQLIKTRMQLPKWETAGRQMRGGAQE